MAPNKLTHAFTVAALTSSRSAISALERPSEDLVPFANNPRSLQVA
jgi:hypothetical protein